MASERETPIRTSGLPGEARIRLRAYLGALVRRRWLVVLALLLTSLTSLVATLRQEPLYEGRATVLLSRQNLANSLTGTPDPTYQQADFARIAQTQAKLATTPTVAEDTLKSLRISDLSPRALLNNAVVEPDPDADLLIFSVRDGTPRRAGRLATEFARQFTRYRRQLDTAAIERARTELGRRLESARTGRSAGGSEQTIERDLYERLLDKDEQLRTLEALQTSNAFVIRGEAQGTKIRPQPAKSAVLGIGAGLLLALAFVVAAEVFDTRVRNDDEISELLDLPVLASLPGPTKELADQDALVSLAHPHGPQAEGFRLLRAAVDFARRESDARCIAVTSAVESEGKSTTVANLAVTMARAGKQVALVDLDLRRPRLHRFFRLDNTTGVTSVAMGDSSLAEALARVDLAVADVSAPSSTTAAPGSLTVLPSGPIPPNPADFIEGRGVASLLEELVDLFEVVFIDTPPALQVGDLLSLTTRVDAVVVVTRRGTVRRPMLRELTRLLERAPVAKLGHVLTGVSQQSERGYDEYYYSAPPASSAAYVNPATPKR